MKRREFLRGSLLIGGGVVLAGAEALGPRALALAARTSGAVGPLGSEPDANGLLLPEGFRSRLLAVGGELVEGTSYVWHPFPDGGACQRLADGGWVYTCNSEVFLPGAGGAGALRFDRAGRIVDAYEILHGTEQNCSGGMMPWGRWLSCEEIDRGMVWDCDVDGVEPAVARPALGVFAHEMIAADRRRRVLYLSEDRPDGLLYRFRPTVWGDLGSGVLEAAAVDADGAVRWVEVTDPLATGGFARDSAPGATRFDGGEGVAVHRDVLYFATKGDNHVLRFDLVTSTVSTMWTGDEPLVGVDNLVVHHPSGRIFVCEDGGNMELVMIDGPGRATPFARFVGHDDSEVTGAAFDPSGTRLYLSSQRAPTPKVLSALVSGATSTSGLGRTFEITGPF